MKRALLLAAIIAAPLSLGACAGDPAQGYALGTPHRADVGSVSVPIFRNETYAHGIELELTDAVIKELRRATGWRVSGSGPAQTTLTATVIEADLQKLSTARTSGLAQELAVSLTVDFEWKDNRTGKVLVARRQFTASEIFVPSSGLNERIEVGEHGATQRLARDIVDELRTSW